MAREWNCYVKGFSEAPSGDQNAFATSVSRFIRSESAHFAKQIKLCLRQLKPIERFQERALTERQRNIQQLLARARLDDVDVIGNLENDRFSSR
jgi:hypothetical protein